MIRNKKIYNLTLKLLPLMLLLLLSSCYRQEVILVQIPQNTPEGAEIFITGNFNNWDPGDPRYRMQRLNDGSYHILLPLGAGKLQYKFTRGDWTTVEKNECGYETGNRSLRYGEQETKFDSVWSWGDTEPMNCIQKVVVIEKIPVDTPEDAEVYLASSFNGWNPGDYQFVMQMLPDGRHYLNLEKQADCMEYKFTLGNWETVETDAENRDISNRVLCFTGSDTVFVSVNSWKSNQARKLRKITLVIDDLPDGTLEGDPIYAAGSFNNWDPGNKHHRFISDSSGKCSLSLATEEEVITFKITRGSWRSVETTLSGRDIPDRSFFTSQSDTLFLKVERWKDR